MTKIACLFPGQGSQSVGMGNDLFDKEDVARKTFEEIDRVAGRSLSQLCFEGPEDQLKRTINTQPTILAVSLAAWRSYESHGGPMPAFVAGHSLGEFTALAAGGALSIEAVVRLVDKRARLMEECPKGAMSAVMGVSADDLEAACKEASHEQRQAAAPDVVIVANFNTPQQLVISGSPEAVVAAGVKAKAKGGKVIPLPVGGAFHSPLMAEAAKEFEQELSKWTLQDSRFPVVQNVDARPAQKGDELKSKLSKQMPSSVRWTATIEYMLSQGVKTFIEIGPGKALAGMVKKIDKEAQVFNIYDQQTLLETLQQLKSTAAV
ncbi:MAG TPA: ACP S-malonyltransferase [Candidatus Obscuribacterales bacterium]